MAIFDWLKGKKTYFIGVAVFVVGGLVYSGVINAETAAAILIFLNGGGLMALRAGVSKSK